MSEDSPSSSPSRWRTTFRALRHRNFQLFFSGQLISLVGTWMQNIAQMWLVYSMTHSSILLGAIGFASQIPAFLAAPFGGAVADRWSRHKLVIATQVSSMILAFILAGLTLTHVIQVWHVFVLAILLGIVNAFDIPGRQAFMVEMVGKEDLMNAIALNSSMFNGARIVGPAVAGILVAKIGEGWCFFANAVSYIAVIAGLSLMKVDSPPRIAIGSAFDNIIEGFRFVRRAIPIRDLMLLLGLVSLVAMPYAVLMPIFADQILHRGANGLGILMGATGVGALLRCSQSGYAFRSARRGPPDRYLCPGFWHIPDRVFLGAHFLAVSRSPRTGRILHDVANDIVEYPDSGHGSGPPTRPRHGRLYHDVHGNGTVRLAVRGCAGKPSRRSVDHHHRRDRLSGRRRCGSCSRLSEFRVVARQMVLSQGLAGGDPVQEIAMTGDAQRTVFPRRRRAGMTTLSPSAARWHPI